MRRLFYVPGLLSLVALAPSLMWFLNSKEVWVKERCIQITFPVEARSAIDSSRMYGRWNIPERNWSELELSGGIGENRRVLAEFEHLAREMAQRHDTLNGLHVTLAQDTKWETIIRAVDVIMGDSVLAWMVDQRDITVFITTDAGSLKSAGSVGLILDGGGWCGTDYGPFVSDFDRVLNRVLEPFVLLKETPLTLWPIAAALVVLLLGGSCWAFERTKTARG